MDKEQKAYLRTSLSSAVSDARMYKEAKQPAIVRNAERIVSRWERAQSRKAARHRIRVEKAASKVRELILFGTREKALAALNAFKRKYGVTS